MGCFQSQPAAGQYPSTPPLPQNDEPSHTIYRSVSGSEEMIVKPGHLVFEVSIASITTRNLEAVDLLNSDPYVRFLWGGTTIHETQHFNKSAVRCRFPETFAFYYSSVLKELRQQYLKVEVFDWNRNGKHQLIGSTSISLKQIATGPVHHDHQLVSTHRANPSPCGRVSFNCTMQSTDVWKMTFSGYRIIYRKSVLDETHGRPFRIRYNYVNNESIVQESLEGSTMEHPRKAFGKLKVLTFKGSTLPPMRWTGSFLKFISGSLQLQLVCVQPSGLSYHGHEMDVQGMEQQFGQIWLPLKKMYATSTVCPIQQQKTKVSSKASSLTSSNSTDEEDPRPSLSSSGRSTSTTTENVSVRDSHRNLSTSVGYVAEYIRRETEFDSDLWLMGQKIGSIAGHVVFERVPPIGQMASGVLTEKGIAAASPVVVGEAVGGTIFHFLKSKGHNKLPIKMKTLGHLFSKIISMNVTKPNKQKGDYNLRKQINQLLLILQESDKFSMISFTYSSRRSLLNSQKLLLTVGNWFMDRIDAVETSYSTIRIAYVGVVLILSRGEIGDLSTLGFDPLAGLNLHKSHIDLKALEKEHLSDEHGPTKSQIDMAMLIRRFLIRCLVHAVERVRYQTKDTKERRFCATVFAVCSIRLPTFGACMARAILPKHEVDVKLTGWTNKDTNINHLSKRCATQYDEMQYTNNQLNWNGGPNSASIDQRGSGSGGSGGSGGGSGGSGGSGGGICGTCGTCGNVVVPLLPYLLNAPRTMCPCFAHFRVSAKYHIDEF